MTKKTNKDLKKIEKNYEELEEDLRERRTHSRKNVLRIIVGIVIVVLAIDIIYALRGYDDYEVTNSIERQNSSVTQYERFQGNILEYSNDGIVCMQANNQIVWNQSFEMISPKLEMCGDYLVIYDAGGTQIYIMTIGGLQKYIETTAPIQAVCVANQGTVAALMKEGNESYVKLFDKKGNELANGKFYGDKGSFAVDIAFSHDGTKMAVSLLDVSKGMVSTTISFYNFGSVGQSEIDNNVGTFTFDGVLIPEIEYTSSSRMVGIGTGKIVVFEGSQKPDLVKEIVIEEELLSCFHNDKYIGLVSNNVDEEELWHIRVIDMRGNTVMENDTSVAYDRIEFLENNEICVTNATECQLFTTHSIKKFSYAFDKEIYKVFSGNTTQNYTFVFKNTIEEVKLK